jgi:hypothetical protein
VWERPLEPEKWPFPNGFFDAASPVAGLQAYEHFMWILCEIGLARPPSGRVYSAGAAGGYTHDPKASIGR